MKIYVGTYAKYNEGSIAGAWLDLSDYPDKAAFYEACAELHSDETAPEFMFQDWEEIPEGLVSECSVNDACWDLLEAYSDFDEGAVDAFVDWYGSWDRDKFEEAYQGEFSSEEDFAEQLADDCGFLGDMPENLRCYFDYERFARDLFIGDYTMQSGHVFRADI